MLPRAMLCLHCSFVSVISAGGGYANAFQRVEISDSHASCHGIWVFFLIQPVVTVLSGNPQPELGVDSVLLWHEAHPLLWVGCSGRPFLLIVNAATEFIAFNFCCCGTRQWPNCALNWHNCSNRTPNQSCFSPVESNTIELSNTLLCHGTWLSFLM